MDSRTRRLDWAVLLGAVALVIVPWYAMDRGLLSLGWLAG
jgi:iron(III) transport system permease protein